MISIGSLNEKFYYIPCSLQSRGILLCDRHGLSTDRDLGESKNDSKGEGDPLPAFPPYTFRSHFDSNKKNPGYIPCTSEYNHKIPFQCFISINSNTHPNFTTTFNFVTSSSLLMGHVSFPIPLGFQSQVED